MRPLKFRQFDSDSKRFHYWGFLPEGFFSPTAHNGEMDMKSEQFTGALDQNGLEIWEGDILDAGQWYGEAVVIWSNGGFKIVAKESNGVKQAGFVSNSRSMEVIGNIHQNPELLKP